MKKKTITITAPLTLINAISLIVIPVSTQKIFAESIYLRTIKKTINICLS